MRAFFSTIPYDIVWGIHWTRDVFHPIPDDIGFGVFPGQGRVPHISYHFATDSARTRVFFSPIPYDIVWGIPRTRVFFPLSLTIRGSPINRGRSFESPLIGSTCLTNNIERALSARVLRLI